LDRRATQTEGDERHRPFAQDAADQEPRRAYGGSIAREEWKEETMSANAQVLGLPARRYGARKMWALAALAAVLAAGFTVTLYVMWKDTTTTVTPRTVPSEVIVPQQASIPAITGTGPGLVWVAEQSNSAFPDLYNIVRLTGRTGLASSLPAITGTGPGLTEIARLQQAEAAQTYPERHRHRSGVPAYSGSRTAPSEPNACRFVANAC
jgi:hypothetical protein